MQELVNYDLEVLGQTVTLKHPKDIQANFDSIRKEFSGPVDYDIVAIRALVRVLGAESRLVQTGQWETGDLRLIVSGSISVAPGDTIVYEDRNYTVEEVTPVFYLGEKIYQTVMARRPERV